MFQSAFSYVRFCIGRYVAVRHTLVACSRGLQAFETNRIGCSVIFQLAPVRYADGHRPKGTRWPWLFLFLWASTETPWFLAFYIQLRAYEIYIPFWFGHFGQSCFARACICSCYWQELRTLSKQQLNLRQATAKHAWLPNSMQNHT